MGETVLSNAYILDRGYSLIESRVEGSGVGVQPANDDTDDMTGLIEHRPARVARLHGRERNLPELKRFYHLTARVNGYE